MMMAVDEARKNDVLWRADDFQIGVGAFQILERADFYDYPIALQDGRIVDPMPPSVASHCSEDALSANKAAVGHVDFPAWK
jgi:hypothetical protein